MSHTRGAEEIFESAGEKDHSLTDVRDTPSKQPISKDIATSSVTPSAAFDYFHGQIYDNNLSAYENLLRDSKNKHRGEVSYALADQLEMTRGAESPFQRFARLKSEMEQLNSDLTIMKQEQEDRDGEGGGAEVSVWRTLQKETTEMLTKLCTLEASSQDLTQTCGISSKHHVEQADRILSRQLQQDTQPLSEQHDTVTLSSSPVQHSEALSKLEQRVYALEHLLSMSSSEMTPMLSGGSKTFPLLENLRSLEQRVNSLDPTVLEVASTKVQQLISELETLNKAQAKAKAKGGKSAHIGGMVSDEQLSMLAERVEALEGFEDELPGMLLRLKTMAGVHQEAASFTARLADLETCADDLSALSQSNGEVLTALQAGFESNMRTLKDNIENLDNRIEKLS
mmetsp:Transcript_7593/g.12787  ORF Transcript_7593/g.12787 Transcript_7593/m.12787 type:complete len:397 (-) Transcript_7593:101-1291(-)